MNPLRAQLTVEDLRAELDAYERRYGVSSERRFDAFPASGRCDDTDLVAWSELYHLWATSQRRTAAS